MKRNIACLLLSALFIMILPLLFAQRDQNSQGPDPEIAALKKRILELESKLQTVENVEKMELAAKLAEAEAKLRNAEFGKFKNELRESNNEWLKSWSLWFLTILGIFAAILLGVSYVFWYWLRSRADQLIEDEVGKSLNSFKEAVGQVNILQDQIRILEKEHAVSVLENSPGTYLRDKHLQPEQIKALREEVLLQVFEDETRLIEIRCGAADVLAVRKSPLLVSPMLKFLNLVVDSDFDWIAPLDTQRLRYRFVSSLGHIPTLESYEGLEQFLNRLLTENPKHKHLFLAWTAFYLAGISIELKIDNSVSVMKKAIPDLKNSESLSNVLSMLVKYFDTFNEPEGIKEILTNGLTDEMPDVEERCLELLQKHDPDFVSNWKAQKESTNTQNEESE